MQAQRSPLPGIILIVLGVLFLIGNFADVRLGMLWPIFVLGPGVAFFFMFMRDRKNYGVLMPAAVLTVTGLLFFACTLFGWEQMDRLWPLFLIAPGLGFILLYLFGKREWGLLIPAAILTGLGLVFLLDATQSDYLWPVVFILVGLLLLFRWNKEPRPGDQPGMPQGPAAPTS